MLLVPLATGLGAAGTRQGWAGIDLKAILFLLACLALFFAHHPLTLLAKARSREELFGERFRRPLVWSGLYLSLACIFSAPLFLMYGLWKLLYLSAIGAGVLLFHLARYAAREEQSYRSTLAAAAGLTLTAPGAYYVSTGTLDGSALILWALNALYFWGGILYVKMRIAEKIKGRQPDSPEGSEKIVLAYHIGAALLAALLSLRGYLPLAVAVAFFLLLLRAAHGAVRGGAHLNIKKMGIQETLYSIAFGAILIATLHGR